MSDPDEIRSDIERTRRELGQDVDALADKVNPAKAAQRQTDKVRRAATRLKDRVMGTASDVVDSTQDAVGHAGEAVADAPRKVASATQGNPIAVGLIAFGVGLLAASLIPASRAEQQAAEKVKDAAAPLVDEAKDVAMESADHLREPAKEAAECGQGAREGRRRDGEGGGPGRCFPGPDRREARRRPADRLSPACRNRPDAPPRPEGGASSCARAGASFRDQLGDDVPCVRGERRVALRVVRQLRERLQQHPAAGARPRGVVGLDSLAEDAAEPRPAGGSTRRDSRSRGRRGPSR